MSWGPLPSCGSLLSGSSGLSALAWEGGRDVKEEQQLCVLQRLGYF